MAWSLTVTLVVVLVPLDDTTSEPKYKTFFLCLPLLAARSSGSEPLCRRIAKRAGTRCPFSDFRLLAAVVGRASSVS
uniref:Secreted protein n=1 Tax=Aegilops tauschii subsp. strangulata TaxID=200361 RepID=A0A453N291_AEGTS